MSSPQPEYGINEATLLRGDHGVITEPDTLRPGRVALVGLVAVLSFIVAGLWAAWMFKAAREEFVPEGLAGIPTELSTRAYEIGIVNQWEFSVDQRAAQLHNRRALEVESYGWVDRGQERIHVPVGQGLEQVLQDRGAAPNRAPAGEQTPPAPTP